MTTIEPPTGLDLAPIRARAVLADQASMGPGALWVVRASANDVPALCDEIEALRVHVDRLHWLAAYRPGRGYRKAVEALRDNEALSAAALWSYEAGRLADYLESLAGPKGAGES